MMAHRCDSVGRVELRPLQADEVRTFDEVRLATWRTAYRGLVPDAYLDALVVTAEMTAARTGWIRDPDRPMHAAVIGDVVVGVAIAGPARDEDLASDVTELGALYVLPPHWGNGIGRALLDAVLARRPGPRQVLWVLEGNQRSCRFYESCGFVVDGTRKVVDLGGPVAEVRYQRSS